MAAHPSVGSVIRPIKTKPHAGRRGASVSANAGGGLRSNDTAVPQNWRVRLPDPLNYYSAHVERLGRSNASGYAQGRCPFHDDHNASLSVHVKGQRGGWRCFAGCGHGDLVAFHERLRGMHFAAAVRDLIGWRP